MRDPTHRKLPSQNVLNIFYSYMSGSFHGMDWNLTTNLLKWCGWSRDLQIQRSVLKNYWLDLTLCQLYDRNQDQNSNGTKHSVFIITLNLISFWEEKILLWKVTRWFFIITYMILRIWFINTLCGIFLIKVRHSLF